MAALRHLLYCAAVCLALVGFVPHCAAQNAAPLALRDKELRLVNEVLDQLWTVMDANEQAILQEIDVRIPMDYDMTRVVAYRADGRVIEVSSGFYGTMVTLCRDWVLANYYTEQDPNILHTYDDYLSYVNDTIDRNDRSVGEDSMTLQPFTEFAGIPEETATQIMNGSDAGYNDGVLLYAAIGFVLAHEIGHHVLGHVDSAPASPEDSRARETEADRYAFDLTMRAGMTAFGALPALAIFTAAESEFADPEATHPDPSCRILGAWIYTLDRLAADDATRHLFDNDPEALPGGSKYQGLMTLMNKACS